jgi:hypothetical protein
MSDYVQVNKKEIYIKGGGNMKRFMIPRIAHCSEGCPILSWA